MSRYGCVNGSQFDSDGDGAGDSLTVTITCQWRRRWSPWPQLPPCVITHCVAPPSPPPAHQLEAVTAAWTPINTDKVYRWGLSLLTSTS